MQNLEEELRHDENTGAFLCHLRASGPSINSYVIAKSRHPI